MSFFQNPSFYIQTAEADIVSFFKSAEAEVTVIEQDFLSVLGWVQANASEIAAFVAGLLGVAASVSGGQIPAALLSAQAALNTGMQLVNSAVAAAQAQQAAGGTVNAQTVSALSAAYAQFKTAQASAATLAATTTTPTTAPAS